MMMMDEFENLQRDLEHQRTQLTGVVEKVNRLIRHHGHEAGDVRSIKTSAMKGAKAAAGKVPLGTKQSTKLAGNKSFKEDKSGKTSGAGIEEEKRSFRGAPRDDLIDEPHSQQASRASINVSNAQISALPPPSEPKNRTQSNWNEEIINTSKEIHGEESQKSRAELQSHRSSGNQVDQAENNFRQAK